jgi:hypothetical protein
VFVAGSAQIPHRKLVPHSYRTVQDWRTPPHRFFCQSLPLGAIDCLPTLSFARIGSGRLPHRKATMSNYQNPFVAGSSPAKRTSFPQQIESSGAPDTDLTQETPESGNEVKFPKRIKHRGRVLATVYGRTKKYGYRVAWNVAGQRRMQRFKTYSDAKKHADDLVRDLAKGGQLSALTPAQARDALAALQCLETYRHNTGRAVSLLGGYRNIVSLRLS